MSVLCAGNAMKRHGNKARRSILACLQEPQDTILFDGGLVRGVSNENDENFLSRCQDDHQIEGAAQPIYDG